MVDKEEQWRFHPRYRDRPRGVLTQREREYLTGESDIEPGSQAERSIRQSIRQHLADSILDFSIILDELEDRDLKQVFNDEIPAGTDRDKQIDTVPAGQVASSATDMVAFVFQQYGNEYHIERKVKSALERTMNARGYDARVDVDIDLELGEDLSTLRDRLEEQGPEALTHRELRTLLDAGELTQREHAELVLEREEKTDRQVRRPPDGEE